MSRRSSSSGSHDVVVTGLGLISALGSDVETTWKSLLAADGTAATAIDAQPDLGLRELLACRLDVAADGLLAALPSPLRRRIDRSTAMALVATEAAHSHAGLPAGTQGAVYIGTGGGCAGSVLEAHDVVRERGQSAMSPYTIPRGLPSAAASEVANLCGWHGEALTVAAACASGATAIGHAVRAIARGEVDLAIAGGVDSPILPSVLAGFDRMHAMSRSADPQRSLRPFDRDRDGFVLGEGAAMLVLESRSSAAAGGRQVLAVIRGVGATTDSYHPVAPDPEATQAARSIALALADAGVGHDDVSAISAHGTGTALNDRAEAVAYHRVFGAGRVPVVTASKGVTGHMMGASAAFEVATAVLMLRERVVPPVANLEVPDVDLAFAPAGGENLRGDVIVAPSFGFGGHNVTIVVSGASVG